MNSTHIHLLLNHFPIIGVMFGSGLLLWGFIKGQQNIKAISAVIIVLMTLIAIPVFLTGEPAEESIEKLPGVSKAMTELHESAAVLALWVMVAAGVAALASLFLQWKKIRLAGTGYAFTLIVSLICVVAMTRAGYYGGQIRHSEIRNGTATEQQVGPLMQETKKDDD